MMKGLLLNESMMIYDEGKSAAIEAKMAAEAAEAMAKVESSSPTGSSRQHQLRDLEGGSGELENEPYHQQQHGIRKSTSVRNSRPRAFSRLLRHRDPDLDPAVVVGGGGDHQDEQVPAAAAASSHLRHLGSPQQLTRSCSCKRPGSFKKASCSSLIYTWD